MDSQRATPREDGMTARERFWHLVCSQAVYLYMLLILVTVMAVLNLLAMALAQQTPGSRLVSVLVFTILAITAIGVVFVLWRCNRRRQQL